MKKIPFSKAQFALATLAAPERFHAPSGALMPEIAIAGRSNAGKSSLINHLLQNSKLAKTSSTPGKTQTLNFFLIDEELVLVDLPGYGYAQTPLSKKKEWARAIDTYLGAREGLNVILLLLDIRRALSKEDLALVDWAMARQKKILLIFTKSDKVNKIEREKNAKDAFAVLYRNNLKNRKFGKEAPQDFQAQAGRSERPLPSRQGASEPENFKEKPTPPKTDSSGCFGINLDLPYVHYSIKDPTCRASLIWHINQILWD